MVERTIQKLEITKLASGESDPGPLTEGVTLTRTKTYTGLGVGEDETYIYRFYNDETVIPDLWLPTSEGSLYAWLDPSDAAAIVSSTGDVSQLTDKSGNGNHFVTGTAPRTGDNTLDGKNVITFTPNDVLQRAVTNMPSTLILTMVAQVTTVTSQFECLFCYNESGTADFRLRAGNASAFNGQLESDRVTGTPVSLTSPPHAGPSVFTIVFDLAGFTAEVYVDGTSYLSAAYATGFNATGTMFLFSNEGAFFLGGHMGDLVMFGGVASSTVRQKAEGYLAHKWGLEGNLPGGHPYKTNPPTE